MTMLEEIPFVLPTNIQDLSIIVNGQLLDSKSEINNEFNNVATY